MERLGAWTRTPDARWLLAVLALALAVRLVVVLAVTPDPRDGRYDDTVWYDTTARHLADGDGYVFDPTVWVVANGDRVYPDENELSPTALWPPGYPAVLSVVYALTGDSVAAGRLANVLFGALTAGLVFLIARRLFDLRTGAFAGFALALLPSHVLFTTLLLSETFFGFLLALVLFVAVEFVFDRPSPNLAVVAGLGALTAATGYVRGEFLAFGVVLALLLALHLRRESLLPLAALAGGALLVVTPWTARNAVVMDDVIVGTTGSGRVAYQGHNPLADGGPSLEAVGRLEAPFAELSRKEIELRSNEEGSRLAREWAWDHKLKELELVGRRMHLLMKNDEAGVTWLQSNKPWFSAENADRLIRLSTFAFYALTGLALVSLPVWWRSGDLRRIAVFSVVPFYLLMFGVLFIGDPRYHYALYVPLAIFGGAGAASVWAATARQWREVAGQRSFMSVLWTYGTPDR